MNISFYGQLGLPKLADRDTVSGESRVDLLGRKLADLGHSVTIFGTGSYARLRSYHGVSVVRVPSLDPRVAGGWLYLLAGLVRLIWQQPGVVQVHGFRAALLLRLSRGFLRSTTLVWTIDTLPARTDSWLKKHLLWLIVPVFAVVTTPTRQLQYRLLTDWGVRARYIPDGYEAPVLEAASLSRWRLRKGGYVLVLADSVTALRRVAKAYKATKSRKKLVVLQEPTGAYARLAKQYAAIKLIGVQRGRMRRSLLEQAAVVVLADDSADVPVVLQAMASGRPVVAATAPLYQEILGLGAQFFTATDRVGLTDVLTSLIGSGPRQAAWGRKARIRAERHFAADRVLEEYLAAYRVLQRRVVPLDSVRPVPFIQPIQA